MTEHARGPRRRPPTDLSTVETVVGPALVARLHGLLRGVRLYDLSNRTLQDQLANLLALLAQLPDDEVVLLAMGQCFYVNGVRIRAKGAQSSYFDALTSEFETRGLGGLRFLDGLHADELAAFLRLFLEHADAERGAALAEAAAAAGIEHVAPISRAEAGSGAEATEAEEPAEDEHDRAVRTFRQAVAGTRSAILSTARTGKPALRKIKRVVQPIVDSIMKDEYSLVGLTAIKGHDEYTYAHCVNVAVLSVGMGQSLGLPRQALADLGVAGLLHDLGKMRVAGDVLRKPGALTAEEWQQMRRHPVEGSKMVARMPGLSQVMIDSMRGCFEHHMNYNRTGYPDVAVEWGQATLSRIIAMADCFDAITAHRAYYKRPHTAFEGLQTLMGPNRVNFDPAVLWALIKTVGLYPAGTVMQTESGHLVLAMSPNPADVTRPNCRVLHRPADAATADGADDEIWDPMPATESVRRVLPPEEHQTDTEQLLAA